MPSKIADSGNSQKPRDPMREARAEALRRLREVGGQLTADEDVLYEGNKLVIPARMNMQNAVDYLVEKIREEERTMGFNKTYPFRPWDGARATMRAFKEAFGSISQRATKSFFGDIPPQMITIHTGPGNQTEQVPWGRVTIPFLPNVEFNLGQATDQEYGSVFRLTAEGPKKYRFEVEGVFQLVEDELQRESMYRGQAFDGQENPRFLDLGGVDPGKVIYSDEVIAQLDANVFTVLRHGDKLEKLGVPLKRAVLFEGPFGTGKTLAAYLTAQVAVANGWTFVYCRPGQDSLEQVVQTARLYQPAVVFLEDVDIIGDPDAESDRVARILDVFDGIQSKGTRLMAILTTNHVERIHKGIMRPGRLDAVIHIGHLDRHGFEKLVKSLVPSDYLGDIDYDELAIAFDGFLPAFAKEAVDRAMRYSLSRNDGEIGTLATSDFVHAANSLRRQLELMEGARDTMERFAVDQALEHVVGRVVEERMNEAKIIQTGDSDDNPFGRVVLPEANPA